MRLLLGILSIVALTLAPSLGQAPARVDAAAEAIRLNNLGVASMNQQKFEPALERFTAALARRRAREPGDCADGAPAV
jgi:hypothetical protein